MSEIGRTRGWSRISPSICLELHDTLPPYGRRCSISLDMDQLRDPKVTSEDIAGDTIAL